MVQTVLSDLVKETCLAHGQAERLEADDASALIGLITGWELDIETGSINRVFSFANYYETIAFVNAVAWIADQQDHHPDMTVSYNKCTITYRTHSVDGLSRNDFICAARINQLFD